MKCKLISLLILFLIISGCCNTTKKSKRYCLTLDLKNDPELIKEYKYYHENEHIWPEIPKGIKEVGITDMQIFLIDTRMFMIIEAKPDFDFENDMKRLSTLPRQKEWEAFVAKYQKISAEDSSTVKWQLMDRVYKLN